MKNELNELRLGNGLVELAKTEAVSGSASAIKFKRG
jgi:hypothetical protein